ncbi:MAG: ROK family protein [Bacteroidales bacterium]|nr:ROK family protein [Bacteroidales bacterium]
MSHCKPYVIGIDMGGNTTDIGVVDSRGKIHASTSIRTKDYAAEFGDFIDALAKAIRQLLGNIGGPQMIAGIGIGAPNANFYSGNIENAANLPWKGVCPLAEMLYDRLGIPVAVTNDANAAAIGEMTYGSARGMRDFIMITLGTGLGSGIVINGQLVYGHDGFAGELGHVKVRQGDRLCGCGQKGCLEAYCSANGVARTAREWLKTRSDDSSLRNLDPETITSKEVYEAAMNGDAFSKEIFDYTGQLMGEAFAEFVCFSSPEAFILFGGLAQAGDLIINPLRKAMEANLLKTWQGKIKIIPSALKLSEAAILGAAALGWKAQ